MNLAVTFARASSGIRAPLVTVETHIANGLPAFHIVGLPEAAVKESKERVRSAIINSQFEFPDRRITVNLAPADIRKSGGRFDLAIAVGILSASRQISNKTIHKYEFAGELALSGAIRPIRGALGFAIGSQHANKSIILSLANAFEASLANKKGVYPSEHLLSVCAHLNGSEFLAAYQTPETPLQQSKTFVDFAHVKGQEHAKHALEVAASGGHNLLFKGPPGSGKTLISECLPSILPKLTEEKAIDVGIIRSLRGQPINLESWNTPPFRAPHHSASAVSLVGGGTPPKPGEISLANHGVLFLDELPEFRRDVLEALREPLESGTITIARANFQESFPANFQLLAAMNPCPCGYHGSKIRECQCTPNQINNYQRKISGPLLDRIDMHVTVNPLTKQELMNKPTEPVESSETARLRTQKAQEIQRKRCGKLNGQLNSTDIEQYCAIDTSTQKLLEHAIDKLGLSARSYQRLLRLARTIADLDDSTDIKESHVAQALAFR